MLGRAALVVAAVRVPRGDVDHLAGFRLMLTVSEPDGRAALEDHVEQVDIVDMQGRVPAVAEKAGQHGHALGARNKDSLVARIAGIDGVGHRYPSRVRHLIVSFPHWRICGCRCYATGRPAGPEGFP
jgi:hypothetical protein